MKRLVITEATVLFLVSLFILCSGNSLQAAKDARPLYVDSLTGWQVWKAIPGATIIEKYTAVKEVAGPMTPKAPAEYEFLYEHAAPMWYLFSLIIPEDVTTYWSPTSMLTLTYTHEHRAGFLSRLFGSKTVIDTLTAESNMMFFVNGLRTRIIPLNELDSPLSVPNPAMPLYSTTQVPAVFARFDFRGRQPDYLLRCVPTDVHSKRR